jgi:hypothetical protein
MMNLAVGKVKMNDAEQRGMFGSEARRTDLKVPVDITRVQFNSK